MSYLSIETSVQSGAPLFLYLFVCGDDQWRYTSAAEAVIYGGETWEPSAIEHGDIEQSNELARDEVPLTFPRTDSFASQFLGYPPDLVCSVTIFRKHRDDDEAAVYWKGRVSSSSTKGNQITVECESIFTSMRRPGLRAKYQRNCLHILYTSPCGVNKADFAVVGTPSAVANNIITLSEAALQDDGYYLGGMLGYGDTLRLITAHSGESLTLAMPIPALNEAMATAPESVTVTIYPGCDGLRTTCNDRFNNLENFLGFPWIPSKNPFGGSSLV